MNFVLESISTHPRNSRNYMEATRGLTYVRVFSETNEVTCGNHIVSNSSLFDLGNNYSDETDKFCVATSTSV